VDALVTGCAGFIGSHLSDALLMDGHRVTGVDCFNDNYGREEKLRNIEQARQSQAFEFVSIDLVTADLHSIVADRDVVFHLAGEPGVRTSWGAGFETYLRNKPARDAASTRSRQGIPGDAIRFRLIVFYLWSGRATSHAGIDRAKAGVPLWSGQTRR
jgi:NAD(P)-dependent dehydrogenase (short-subunit alcohol dehydrogenase family)